MPRHQGRQIRGTDRDRRVASSIGDMDDFAFLQFMQEDEDCPLIIVARKVFGRRRRVWLRRHLIERPLRSEYRVLMEREKAERATFHEAYRMTPAIFEELLELVRPHIEAQRTHLRQPIGAAERLGMTIRYLATGRSHKDIGRYFCVGCSTVCDIIPQVCQAIWEVLQPSYMRRPTRDVWRKTAEGFWYQWNFPRCLGAIDGKCIRVQKPELSGSQDLNYKRFYGLVLLAVADSIYRFIYIDVGEYGKECEGSVFAQSTFGRDLEADRLDIPKAQEGELPYVFIGDEAFPLKHNILQPYPTHHLNAVKGIFNYRLNRARHVVESSLGILVNKWCILRQPIIAKLEKVNVMVKAMCILHNFLREKEGLEPKCVEDVDGLQDISARLGAGMHTHRAAAIREKFTEFFISPEGRLAEQTVVPRGQVNH